MKNKPEPSPVFDNDLARDNIENDLPAPDRTDIRRMSRATKSMIPNKT